MLVPRGFMPFWRRDAIYLINILIEARSLQISLHRVHGMFHDARVWCLSIDYTVYCLLWGRQKATLVYVWSPNESAYRGAYTPCVCGVGLLSAWIRVGLSRNPSRCRHLFKKYHLVYLICANSTVQVVLYLLIA